MDSLQEQISILIIRVDALQQTIERLSNKTSEVLAEVKTSGENEYSRTPGGARLGRYGSTHRSSFEAAMEHKDVLVDSTYPDADGQSGDRILTPEIQIQRLTAQLTAAYNRIAALEEQLLAQRIH